MFGITVNERCICGAKYACEYGAVTYTYKDDKGEFYVSDNMKCPKCGHIINSERIEGAKATGVACF